MSGPLEGLLVIDASWGSPGAIATMLLADYGAEVVKVERPDGGAGRRDLAFKAWNRSKRSIALDPTVAADRANLLALLARADVFVESYGRDRSEALGLAYPDTRAVNAGLIHSSLTAYGADGPWSDRPGYDALVAARMGMMAEQPGHRPGPIFLGHPSVAYTSGFLTAIGTLAAVHARHVTGRGQQVDVSLLDGVLGQAPMNWWFTSADESYLSTEEKGHFGHRRVLIDLYECGDGEYLMIHSGGQGSFKAIMEVLGVGDDFRTIEGKVEMSVPLDEHEFHVARKVVPTLWKQRSRDEWLQLLLERDVAVVPVLRPGEILDHEQVQHAELVVEVPDREHGTLRQLGPGIRFSASPAGAPGPAPEVGEHDDQLGELLARPAPALNEREVDHPHALTGIKVLDFSQFMAAAYGAKYLSDLGADVIKVENPQGDPMRSLPDPFEACQRGKKAVTLDLRTQEGREAAYRLVAEADIVVHNLRPGKAEKIGIDYETLRAIKPDLIYLYQPGWGSTGPYAHRKSFAPLVSAMTGLMVAAAGEGNRPVRRARASEDYYGGFLGAVAALSALRHRDRTGEGQYVECPQFHASLFVVSEHMQDGQGALLPSTTLDQDQLGIAPLYRLFQTSDGWVCVAAVGDGAHQRLREALELDGDTSSAEATAKELEALASTVTAEELAERLDAARVPCEVALEQPRMPDFFWEEWALERDFVFEHDGHETWGYIREVGLTIRLSDTPGRKVGPGPLLGEHNEEVLGTSAG